MMKANVSSTKLKGTVLFTVVSVLMVLIVILLGTLALAATASNRAYHNYQKEQTEYTARALLDSVVAAVNADESNDGIKAQIAALGTEGDSIEIEIVRSDNPRKDAEGKPVPEIVTVTKLKSQYYYIEKVNPETSQPYGWTECNVYDLSTVVTKTKAETTYSVKMTDMPNIPGTTGGAGGAFVSMGDGVFPTGGIITGGTAVGLHNPQPNTEDYHIENGSTGQPVVIETEAYFRGNLTIACEATFRFTHMKSHIAVTGDMGYGNAIKWAFSDTFAWNDNTQKSYQEIPCFYVGGKFYNTQATDWAIGNDKGNGHPVNLYCGYMHLDRPSTFFMSGDVYAFNEDATSVIRTVQRSALYEWTSKNIHFEKGEKANYGFGSFYSAGSAEFDVQDTHAAMEIEGDLRVAKNLTCTKNVTVGGDAVVGDTLTIPAGSKLTVKGDLYASTLANFGQIECTGNIYVFTITSPGTCNKEIVPSSTAGMAPSKTKTEWVENVIIVDQFETYPYTYSYTYTKFTKEGAEETREDISETNVMIAGEGVNPYYFDPANSFEGRYATAKEMVEDLDPKYKSLKELESKQGRANATEVNTFDISALYKQPIYPEEFTQDRILDDIIKEKESYTPAKYSSYPQTIEDFKNIYGLSDASPVYTSDSDIKTKTGTGVITQSCTIKGSWGASDDNIYINANGKKIAVVLEGLAFDNSKSIVINESNGGEVNFFIAKDTKLELKSGASFLTTDIIKRFESTTAGPGGKDAVPTHTYDSDDEYYLKTNFAQVTGGNFGFATMKSGWEVQKYADPIYPDVYIFAGENSAMTCANAHALAVNVRAPLLKFEAHSSGQMLGKAIEYTDESGETRTFESGSGISMVGQLIAGDIKVPNNFGMLYVAKENPDGSKPPVGSEGGVPDDIYTLYYDYY